ncbi:MAG: HAD-IC family P-type ATPase, partial [Pseudomonadales bacterium]
SEAGPCCWFQLHDRIREDARDFRDTLHAQGLRLHILSGDSSGSAEKLCDQLQFDYCVAGATATQKLDYIQQLQQRGARVMMLGDGINDIPVLAAGDVSVAMSNASDLAKTHSDCILLSGRLQAVIDLQQLADRTRQTIRQNLAWALAYNLVAIPLAVQGLVPPYLAAIGMSLSSLLVVLNSLRLQRWSRPNAVSTEVPVTPAAVVSGPGMNAGGLQ